MKTLTYFFISLIVLALVATGCSPSARLPCPEPGEKIADLNNEQEWVALTLKNNTCMSICVLLVSPNHCEYMGGPNWVKDHPLRSGESVTREIPQGRYAVWVELCSEEYRADENLTVRSDRTYRISDDSSKDGKPPCDTSLTIVNQTSVPICKLWISNTESAYTSYNWLGTEPIQPGESFSFTLRANSYIIRTEDCDGNWLRSESEAAISGHQTWTVP